MAASSVQKYFGNQPLRVDSRVLMLCALVACGARSQLDVHADPAAHADAAVCDVTLASDGTWQVFADESSSTPLGLAQPVCLNPSSPSNCPSGAVLFGKSGWSANISALDGALWVWRPGIKPNDASDFVKAVFVRSFTIDAPSTGSLGVAADDLAEVKINGHSAGITGSIVTKDAAFAAQSSVATFDLTPYLVVGSNTLVVAAQNGPPTFASCSGPCTYADNTAGVVFGGRIQCRR